MIFTDNNPKATNFIFLGEAGCGKSEVAIDLALELAKGDKPVHFFDMDMTKPLFRSRDVADMLRDNNVIVHFEQQFYDAPTLVGGVTPILLDDSCYTILDVGGDHQGARAVGGFNHILKRDICAVYYMVNPYRPWSDTPDHIDGVLGQILGVSRLQFQNIKFIINPNLGLATKAEDITEGAEKVIREIGEFVNLEFCVARRELADQVSLPLPVYPIDLHLSYEWEKEI